ncbi:beta-N-acetylhexosaminidase family protein [Seonamhaeicola marinus]|uniref:Carbohydrate-binding family 6 protein n=1 Tax=Seonamhaeicola marinus TaxID=1912246 RepID=A0A5D0I4Y4_9FLAO|nr:hypothetical protein [Seonamhaeicola marinus]TYA78756.1 hypothetical protein FUA24_10415 [Seonamhaeicola marinus]
MFRNFVFITLLVSVTLFNCSKSTQIQSPLVDFAKEHVKKAIDENGLKKLNITWIIDSSTLKPQAYKVSVHAEKLTIAGGDELGLMYGGLEVSEQLSLNGNVVDTAHEPFILKRGLKMNIPLDARTPSYDDSGDAAIKNVKTVWEWDFWKNYLDQMAVNRYNVLSLWNPHPFPSLIQLKDYPEVALDDIYTTSYTPNGLENEMGDPGLVSSVVFDNLKLVKKQSIEEKIAFWQKVMAYAHNRGIDIYWVNWNICPNSVATPVDPMYKTYRINMTDEKPGKHGITHQMDNPITIAYHRAAVKEFLKTYPYVKGIGITSGEHMPLTWEGSNREEWVWNTYGLGILDFKKEQPNRKVDLIHRVWHSDMAQIMNYWGEYPDDFDVSFKYAKARLYSSPSINFYDDHIASMKQYNLKSWWNLRNDDIFVYRWANTDYVRAFIANMPQDTKGYYMGSDGYVWAKEFISKVPELSGEYEFDKHKFKFMLWGRLGYNNELSEEIIFKTFDKHYNSKDNKSLFRAWQTASKIIPQVNRFHWRNWDADWSVESCRAREKLGGFRDVFDFVNNPVMSGQNLINPRDYALKTSKREKVEETTPLQVSENLIFWGYECIDTAEKLYNPEMSAQSKALISDIKAMGYLGIYYAHKINAAVDLAYYNLRKEEAYKIVAISNMEKALEAVIKYAHISNLNYKPQMLARPGALNWNDMVNEVKKELEAVKKLQ